MIDLMIINYNMPEAVTEIMDSIHSKVHHRWIVVDNGSDIVAPHPKTSIFVLENKQVMGGFLAGLDLVKSDFFWDFSTSMSAFKYEADPIKDMLSAFSNEDVVAVFPAFTSGVKAPTHKVFNKQDTHFHQTPIGGFDGMWRTEWINGHIDHAFTSWGVDIDLGFRAHFEGKTMLVDNCVTCDLVERRGYPDRRKVSEEENNRVENDRMNAILSEKYGANWRETDWLRGAL